MAAFHNILSLNVRGLRDSKKRREIFRWLKRFHDGNDSIIFLQETHTVERDKAIWEKEWGGDVYLSDFKQNSRGVAILLPKKIDFIIDNVQISTDGRKIILEISKNEITYCLINIYSPTQDLEDDQIMFYKNLLIDVENNVGKKLIIGGDFNLCLKPIDNSNNILKKSKARDDVMQMIKDYNLLDIWRLHHPDIKRFSWRRSRPNTQCRLDYWLIGSEMCYDVASSDIKPSIKTDHSLISLKLLDIPGIKKGTGLWKFNAQLLADEVYVEYIKGIILMQRELLKDLKNDSLKWELLKMEIRKETSVYSKTQALLGREYENNLQEQYKIYNENFDIDHNNENEIKLSKIREEIEKINAIKTEGYRVRSKAEFIEHNERSSKFFFNLEKKNAIIKNITRLKKDNSDLTDTYGILNELSSFYKQLYTESEYNSDFENEFLSETLPQISNNDKILCDNEISLIECCKALEKMKGNKSPGTDGLTAEFYQYFWNEISDLVLSSFKTAFTKKVLSCEQKRGVIRLIPKKDKDLTDVGNWRPISLLNTDYKIIAHVLANRLQQALPDIISKDQSGYLKNRNISLNIRTIYDIINDKENKDSSAFLAFIDFKKALIN